PGIGAHSATLSALGLHRLTCQSHGNSLPHVAIHLPAESLYLAASKTEDHRNQQRQQQQQGQQPVLVMRSPELLKQVLHEMGHAISMILSACAAPSSVFGNVGFASTDVQELSAHVLERCAFDAHSLVALSGGRPAYLPSTSRDSPTQEGNDGVGQRLRLSDAAQLAEHLRARSAIELHQQVLLAISDLQLHSCRAGDEGSLEGATDAGPDSFNKAIGTTQVGHHGCASKDIVRGVWHKYGILGTEEPACTQQVLRLLPRLLHTPALMAAYPMCDVLSAAIWKQHALSPRCRPVPREPHMPAQVGGQKWYDSCNANAKNSGRTAVEPSLPPPCLPAHKSKSTDGGICDPASGETAAEADVFGFDLTMPDGAPDPGWLAVRERIFEAGAGADLESLVVGLLGARCMRRVPLLQGNDALQGEGASPSCGVGFVPDIASDVFQDIDM
ncbi:hypothetical protein DUNSADRAFT_13483, partial [Dunaliella salina]